MSNCVTVHNTLAFALDIVDADRLFADIDKYNAMPEPSLSESPSLKRYCIWWFLGNDNVFIAEEEPTHLYVDLGDHRSMHTWRDLRQTLHILNSYVRTKGNKAVMTMSDESDGFATTYKYTFDLDTLMQPEAA